MTDLIARLSSAEGPSRELDAEIWLALHHPDWRERKDWKKTNGWASESRPSSMVSFYTPDGLGGSLKAPAYSSSVDAALTLVPEGWDWDVSARTHGTGGVVYLHSPDRSKWRDMGGFASTPAISVVIAALRAKGVE